MNTVRGCRIQFASDPYQSRRPHPIKFNQSHSTLIKQEVKELLFKGVIVENQTPPTESFHSTLFLVPKKDGGQRPVINLKALDEFVSAPHFKMEGIHTLKTLLQPGDWMAKVDLKYAYFSIPIHPDHRKYLHFQFLDKTYQFTRLPFGLASAPWVFTKTLRPAAALARELGMRVIVYIDDILLMAESREKLCDQTLALVYLLECLGFVINSQKTVLEPTQSLVFLGFTVNSTDMELRLPPEKMKKIRAEARKLRGAENVTARSLSRLIGKMQATNEVIPPAPLFYRHLQMDLKVALRAASQDYETNLTLSPASKSELEWWETELVRWNGRSVLIRSEPDLTIDSDASRSGWGAHCQGTGTGGRSLVTARKDHAHKLPGTTSSDSCLKTFAKSKTSLSVLMRIDNMTAVANINNQGGTVSEELVLLTRDLWMWCLERNIHILAQHFPGKQNIMADRESRSTQDRSDWSLDPTTFLKINQTFGPLEVDLFASRLTRQCHHYFSWRPDLYAEATDALLQDWASLKGFANPPWNLISRVLAKTQTQRANIVLVTQCGKHSHGTPNCWNC